MPIKKLNRKTIPTLKPEAKAVLYYDENLKGFGLKIEPTGARSFFIEYRPGAGGRGVAKKRMALGSADTLSPEQARALAADYLAGIRRGEDPASDRNSERSDPTVADLCDEYLKDGIDLKKASTIATDRGRIERHIKPLLGKKKVKSVTKPDIEKFMRDVAAGKTATVVKTGKQGKSVVTGGKGTATRTVRLLGGIFSWAVNQKMRPDNPAHGIKKYPDQSGERYLSSDELARLGEAIALASTVGIQRAPSDSKHAPKALTNTIDEWAAAGILLLILTGCRLGEVLNLRWDQVDLERGLLFLPDSKTGRKTIVLSGAAMLVLKDLKRVGDFVITGADPGKPRADLKRPWTLVKAAADLDGVRLHDLRHTYASIGAGGGLGLPVIGKLLGHADVKTTARYSHLDADPVRRAADMIADNIVEKMRGK